MIALILVIGAGFGIKLLSQESTVPVRATGEFPNPLGNDESSKPSTFLGRLVGVANSTPTPTPQSSDELSNQLEETVDDGGESDLDALEKELSEL